MCVSQDPVKYERKEYMFKIPTDPDVPGSEVRRAGNDRDGFDGGLISNANRQKTCIYKLKYL